jgi:hypothetical protein
MIVAELPLSIYALDAVRATAEAFRNFCACHIAVEREAMRVDLTAARDVDEQDLGRSFLNYALSASIEERL